MKHLLIAMALTAPAAHAQSAHEFIFDSLDGGTLSLADFPDQTLLVVNTASFCAFTPQYAALQALADAEDQVTVIGLPTGDFGDQEHDTNAEVADFCAVNYDITFPMSEIVTARGPDAHPFFAWVVAQGGAGARPGWNFHKWVIAPDGTLRASFPSEVTPNSPQLAGALSAAGASGPPPTGITLP